MAETGKTQDEIPRSLFHRGDRAGRQALKSLLHPLPAQGEDDRGKGRKAVPRRYDPGEGERNPGAENAGQ